MVDREKIREFEDRFDRAVAVVLEHEGGYVDDHNDPGGATNYGISLRYLKSLPKSFADINRDGIINSRDIAALSIDKAKYIYRKNWWDALYCQRINNDDVATKLFDLAVNMGSRQAVKIVQRALRSAENPVKIDGRIGPKTHGAINLSDPPMLLGAIRSEAACFYKSIVAEKSKFKKYLKGWLNRAYS